MARSMRIEFPRAVYHVTSRGDRREAIFDDDQDAQRFLAVLGQATDRFGARLLAYCLMTNHYHLVLVTPTGGLSLHMRHINGVHAHVPYRVLNLNPFPSASPPRRGIRSPPGLGWPPAIALCA
jgi:REP element-mobilizing transposase RayT